MKVKEIRNNNEFQLKFNRKTTYALIFIFFILSFTFFLLLKSTQIKNENENQNENQNENEKEIKNKKQNWDLKKEKICILMVDDRTLGKNFDFSSNKQIPFFHTSIFANSFYSKYHGYDFYRIDSNNKINDSRKLLNLFQEAPNLVRLPPWSKLKMIYLMMNYYDYEIILYLDSDSVFFDFERTIEDFIVENVNYSENISLILTRDRDVVSDYVNSGVLIFINNDFSKKMILDWYNLPITIPDFQYSINGGAAEQTPMGQYMYKTEPWKSHIHILPLNTTNGPDGEFIRHFWGAVPWEERSDQIFQIFINYSYHFHNFLEQIQSQNFSSQISKFIDNP
ncbi:alpha-16-mannosyltransferase mnn11-related [Anaeramoeba ignava]|uniref:Alpha-16-mannosyltransferase mnn11-related n=1 Tax=Anaeramoeba ignava TaxID=1746090 RepID=A0A9Q0LSD5_ANAIG|nr:alpha-16-mannosyltransferase mnn11-related [Anaeramoeba ignava]